MQNIIAVPERKPMSGVVRPQKAKDWRESVPERAFVSELGISVRTQTDVTRVFTYTRVQSETETETVSQQAGIVVTDFEPNRVVFGPPTASNNNTIRRTP
jgi:hypothetical protein